MLPTFGRNFGRVQILALTQNLLKSKKKNAGVPPCISCFFVARFLDRVRPEEKNYTELEQRLYTELEQRLQYFFYVLHVKRPPTTVIRPELYSEDLAVCAADPELQCLCSAVLSDAVLCYAVLCCAMA